MLLVEIPQLFGEKKSGIVMILIYCNVTIMLTKVKGIAFCLQFGFTENTFQGGNNASGF